MRAQRGPGGHPREQVLARIDKARRRRAKSGRSGSRSPTARAARPRTRWSRAVFLDAFRNPVLEPLEDGAVPRHQRGRLGSPPTRSWSRRCSSPAGTSATSRSTGRSTTSRCAVPPRCTCRRRSSSRRASQSRTCSASSRRWPRRRGAGVGSSPATRRSSSGARPTAATSTPPASACSSARERFQPRRRAPATPSSCRADRRSRRHGHAGPRRAGHLRGHRVRHRPAARDHRPAPRRRRGRSAAAADATRGGVPPSATRSRSPRSPSCSTRPRCVRPVVAAPRSCSGSTRSTWHARAGWSPSSPRSGPTPRSPRCGNTRWARVPR